MPGERVPAPGSDPGKEPFVRILRRRYLIALVSAVAIGAFILPLGSPSTIAKVSSGGRATAHRAGGKKVSAGKTPKAQLLTVGHDALEPTLGVTKEKTLFFAAAGRIVGEGTAIMKSLDGGRSWEDTSPGVLGRHLHPITLDPYIWVDEPTGRLFSIDLTVACSYMSFSDDQGETWTTNPLACGRPVNDHQTLFGGPPALSPTAGYPHVLYYCWNDFGAGTSCSKSLDGGIGWVSTGQPAFLGVDPGNDQGSRFQCGGFIGHGVVDGDGVVYLPKEHCGRPFLGISRDEGTTWEHVQVSDLPTEAFGSDTSVAVDKNGTIYYLFQSMKDRQPYLVFSKDDGKSWSRPKMVGHPDVNEMSLPTLDVGKPGAVALAYVGSTNGPYSRCGLDCTDADYAKTTWNGYIGMSPNVFAKEPVFFSAPANHPSDPIFRGRCDFSTRCGPILDFIDVEISPDGTPYGSFVDACIGPCVEAETAMENAAAGIAGRLVGGPRLR